MNTRTMQVSLSQAKEWFSSENTTLKKLALSVFEESDLIELNYNYIVKNLKCCSLPIITTNQNYCKVSAYSCLLNIAKYLNKDWKKTNDNTGYFFIKSDYVKTKGQILIQAHSSSVIPGIVYFKSISDVNTAIKLLGKDIKFIL